jgi:polysaccharide chain length determinant protein (PEP-CTERM system associated)
MHELIDQLFSHVRAVWRYRWYAALVSWIVAIAGWVVVHQMPNRYEASARVYVDTQSVLRPLLAGLAVQPNVSQIVNMMSRTLISRPNLEKVIGMADIDIRLKSPEAKEGMIARLNKEVMMKSGGAENLYIISYTDNHPQEAKRIVQSLLTIFVEGNLGNSRKDSDSARRFINEQLAAYSEKLVAAEQAVAEFKRKNVDKMGSEGQTYYARLSEAQTALNQASLGLREATNSRDAIKKQLAAVDEAPPSLIPDQPGAAEYVYANAELDARIQELQKQLDGLQLRYTDTHPDILAINRSLKQLKEQREKDKEQKEKEQKEREAKNKKSPTQSRTPQSPVIQQLTVSLSAADANVASMSVRVAEYEKRFNALRAAANAIPQVDAEFIQLTRDYEVNKKNYESLLARRESAAITGDMEANNTVMNFRVIDPPQVPSAPSAPNRPSLVSMVLLGALVAGVLFAFLMSQIRPTIGDERKLRLVAGLPVFGTVIMAWTPAQMRRRKRGVIGLVAAFLGLLSVYATILGLLMFTAART